MLSKFTSVERSKYLLETGLHADCEFLVGDGVLAPKELIRAHQIFLAMSSPVFEAMFFGEMTQAAYNSGQHNDISSKNEPISLPDLTPSFFNDLLQYIYTNTLILQSMDQAMGLCYAAKKYILPDLVSKCLLYVQNNLCPEYTCRVLEFTKLFDDEHLKSKCLHLLRERTRESFTYSDFEDLSESMLLSIVKEEALNIRELELFDAVKRWAGRQCTQKELEINGTNMREVLNEIINEIRFLSMTSEDFASSPVLSGILNEKECMAIFMNLNNPDNIWPMPVGLSPSKNQRRASVFSSGSNSRATGPTRKMCCCLRQIENETHFIKEPFDDFITIITIDQSIILEGVVIAEIVLPNNLQQIDDQTKVVLDCQFLDSNGTVFASARVSKPLIDRAIAFYPLYFDRPIRLKRNPERHHASYRINVVVNQQAYFLLGTASTSVSCGGVQFQFSTNQPKDGLVRGVIFSNV